MIGGANFTHLRVEFRSCSVTPEKALSGCKWGNPVFVYVTFLE